MSWLKKAVAQDFLSNFQLVHREHLSSHSCMHYYGIAAYIFCVSQTNSLWKYEGTWGRRIGWKSYKIPSLSYVVVLCLPWRCKYTYNLVIVIITPMEMACQGRKNDPKKYCMLLMSWVSQETWQKGMFFNTWKNCSCLNRFVTKCNVFLKILLWEV